ncbi:phospholipase D-like domain-containing protein [Dongshaea marina]|uniref:phospholipase D-like domain-containing protein n=1 Tax=Dongshaea marina TaxID=2047966 RepID=UPI000D3E210C|nr:phosphatidylserine/phosphatidylglycerophosphate/cardiolipin synthase family protein [Dongshaea marina]
MDLLKNIHETLVNEKNQGSPQIEACDLFNLGLDGLEGTFIENNPLIRAQEIFTRARELIQSAQSEVLISLYKFQSDSDGALEIMRGLQFLSENRRQVKVRVVVNKKSGPATLVGSSRKRPPIDYQEFQRQDLEPFDINIADHKHKFVNSNHSKVIVVDGKVAIVMSGDPSLKNNFTEDAWMEIGSIVHGGVVQSIRNHFVTLWSAENVSLNHGVTDKVMLQQANIKKHYYRGGDGILYLGKSRSSDMLKRYASPYKIALLMLLEQASESVNLMCNNINDPDIINALAACVHRGVVVKVLVGRYHGETAESIPLAGGSNLKSLQKLMALSEGNGQENLLVHWACDKKGHLTQNMGAGTIHAKLVLVDSEYILTGSSLPDLQSCYHSRESDLLIRSKEHAQIYHDTIFYPVLNISISQDNYADVQIVSREQIKRSLPHARDQNTILMLIENYINMRERERRFYKFRRIFRGSSYDRTSKISAAIKLKMLVESDMRQSGQAPSFQEQLLYEWEIQDLEMTSSELKALQDGLLKSLYLAVNQLRGEEIKISRIQ